MKAIQLMVICAALICMTGCMALNRIDLTLSRNITVGRELMDLNEAKEKGVISEKEYEKAKRDILEAAGAVNVKLND